MKTPSTANHSVASTKPNTDSNPMKTSKTNRSRKPAQILVGSILALLAVQSAHAASQVWDGDTSALWSLGGNWLGDPLDADVPATTNTATFNSAGGADDVIDVSGVTIGTILFDLASAAAYTIGSGLVNNQALTLDDSGAVTMNATVAADELFNAGVALGTATAGTYTFTNNSLNTLTFAGTVQGGTGGAGGAKALTVNGTRNTTISGVVANGGATSLALTKTGAGTLVLNGSNSYTGVTTISGGVLSVSSLANAGANSNLGAYATPGETGLLLSGGTLKYTGGSMGSAIDRGFTINAASTVNVAIAGELKLGACKVANGFDGNFFVTGLGTSSKLSISSLTLGTGTYVYLKPTTANLDIGSITGNTVQIDNIMSGSPNTTVTTIGAITFTGTTPYQDHSVAMVGGTLILTGYNTFPGTIRLGNGILKVNSSDQLGTCTAYNAIQLGNNDSHVNRLMLLNDSSTDFTTRGGGKVRLWGNGYVYVGKAEGGSGSNNTHTLGAATYESGKSIIIQGDSGYGLTLGVGTAGGAFALTNNLVSPGVLTLASLNKASGLATFTIGGTGNTTISGAVTNALALTKNGAGTLTLNGVNTYTGTTAVTSGMLVAGHANALGTTAVNTAVSSGATLDVRAALVAEPISVTGTGVGAAGALITAATFTGSLAGPVTLTGNTSIGGAGTLAINGAIGAGFNVTKVGAGETTFAGLNTYSGTTTVSLGTLVAAHADALGTTGSNTTVSSGATLDVRATLAAEPISITGTGVGGFGALITPATFIGTVIGELTLTGNTSIGGAGTGILNINGIVAAGANTLTTLGTGVTTFGAASDLTSLTNLVVTDGTTNVNSALGTAGNAVVTVSDSPVTKLRFGTVSQTLSSLTIGAGATVIFTSGAASGSLTGDDGGGKAAGFGSPASSFGGGATVPEPGTLGLLLVGALGMLNRRRRA